MSNDGVNSGRRRFLLAATSGLGAVGAAGVAVPFVASWNPSEKAKAAGAPVKIDISKLQRGQLMTVEWRGKPVWVLNRNQEMLDSIKALDSTVVDPSSDNLDQQPAYCKNPTRSVDPNVLIVVGICTHLGCSPGYYPEAVPQPFDSQWGGGFQCPCHGSKFDLAGRVYKGVPAPTNLVIPPHNYITESIVEIGVDPKAGES